MQVIIFFLKCNQYLLLGGTYAYNYSFWWAHWSDIWISFCNELVFCLTGGFRDMYIARNNTFIFTLFLFAIHSRKL